MYHDYEYEPQMFKMSPKESACQATGGLGAIALVMGVLFCINPEMNLMHTGALLFSIGLSFVAETVFFMLGNPKVKKLGGPGVFLFGLASAVMGMLYMLYTTVHPIACLGAIAFGEMIMLYKLMPEKDFVATKAQ